MHPFEEILPAARAMLDRAGRSARELRLELCAAGGNNQVFRMTAADAHYIVKRYFRHPEDPRDRLAVEFDFLRHAQAAAPGWTPRALARDDAAGLGLYEFIEGLPFAPDAVGPGEVAAARSFFRALNAPSARAHAHGLPEAAEACFTLTGHLDLVEARIRQLTETKAEKAVDREAQAFCRDMAASWPQLARQVRAQAQEAGIDPEAELAPGQRCLSPSDFGFHNALRTADGHIRFFDFEYAGWDDPAKTVGDFFSQLSVPVPIKHWDGFVAEAMDPFENPVQLAARARILLPVYRLKWCCIVLNLFLPVHLARRRFANTGFDEAALKRAQFDKARKLYQSATLRPYGLH